MSIIIPWIAVDAPLPHGSLAADVHDGLLAVTDDISPARLRAAYSNGIFPWYQEGESYFWFCPEPRAVLQTAQFRAHRSLRQRRKQWQAQGNVQIRIDHATAAVITGCATRAEGTWITDSIKAAYLDWAALGEVHSVETWIDGQLVGGFYGVNIGRMFYGDSMFSRVADASKMALYCFCEWLQTQGVDWIDCQQATPHLASLGANTMPRDAFLAGVAQRTQNTGAGTGINWLEARQLNLL